MSIVISDKTKCTGCYACFNACPNHCIEMKEDLFGFKYPSVDKIKCIDCGKCELVCPISGHQINLNNPIDVYAAWSTNEMTRINSTSGGVFSELAEQVLLLGGCVVGAIYGENNVIQHSIVYDKAGLPRVRQSKYAQSEINAIFSDIHDLLKSRMVIFCGTPCQVAGLRNYLHSKPDNLITVDFVCRGVNSPKALREWIREIENSNKSSVETIWFKYKEDGWHNSPKCTKIEFADGREIVYKGKKNAFMSGYLGPNLYIRPSCGNCHFKGENRASDITLGDFWGISRKLDNNMGTSLVLINTEKGAKLLARASRNLFLEKRNIKEILDGNICFKDSVKINEKSEQFLKELDHERFSKLVYRFSRKSIMQRINFWANYLKKQIIKKGD